MHDPLSPSRTELFDRLYREHAPRVMGFLLRLTGGRRAEAEDLTQDTFLAAYEGWERFGGRGRPLSWLLGIAWRRWRDRRRSPASDVLPLDEGRDGATPAGKSGGVEEKAIHTAVLERALTHLEPPEREALLLVAVQGLTYREAAEALGEPIGTVKWRVHEATRRLQRLLAGAFEEMIPNHETQSDRTPGRTTAPATDTPCGG